MGNAELAVVTGAFGFTGKYIAKRLLSSGTSVRTLTRHPHRHRPYHPNLTVERLAFEEPARLAESLRDASVLYNTYWVRFPYKGVTFDQAIKNSQALFEGARQVGIRKVVHMSITNPSEDSPFPYFRGKAVVEKTLMESGVSYAVLRPTVVFGPEDLLINNIAWLLRRFPIFGIPGNGGYRLQPVYVDDVARMAVETARKGANTIEDAAGPEVFTFEELVRTIAQAVRSRAWIIHMNPPCVLSVARLVDLAVRDVILTRTELHGLMSDLLISHGPATAPTRFTCWLRKQAASVGTHYASELARHYR